MLHSYRKRTEYFRGKVLTVAGLEYELPDGRSFTYEMVEHRGAVTLIPIDRDGAVLFVRQFRAGSQSDLLELPAGMLEEDEDPLSGAAREVREEIGMAAGKLTRLGHFYMAPGYSTEHMHVYMATELYTAPLPQDEDEFLSIVRLPFNKALQMARTGQILDGKTLAALLLAEPLLEGRLVGRGQGLPSKG